MMLSLKNAKIFRGKGVPLEPGVLEIMLKDLHPEIKFPEILGPPQFSNSKKIEKEINVNIGIVNPPPEIKIFNFFK